MHILRSIGYSFLCICFFVSSASGQLIPQTEGPTSHAATLPSTQPKAQVLFTILDSAGGAVSALSKDEMHVQIDGKPVEVEEIRSLANEPLLFSVVVDLSGSTRPFANQQVAAASKLFLALSRGNSQGYLIFFTDELRTSDQFVDEQTAEQMLKQIPLESRFGSTALYDAIVHACRRQLGTKIISNKSRRAIFLFSDGEDNCSHYSLLETVKIAQSEGIPIFSIGLSSHQDSESLKERKREFAILNALSQGTGGLAGSLDDPHDVVARLQYFLQGQNLLTFKPVALKPKKHYSLKIETSAKDVHVWAATEYVAPY